MDTKQTKKEMKEAEKKAKKEKKEAEKKAEKEKKEAEKKAKKEKKEAEKKAEKLLKKEDPAIMVINERIKKEICYNTLFELKDEKLLPIYKKCDSVVEELKKQEKILDKYVDSETKEKIMNDNDNILQLIPAGTKGVIRGNKFNEIVKELIIQKNPDIERYEICFEKNCDVKGNDTSEKPDWYITEKLTKKTIIGMNQLDLWTGGAQTNRASKYIHESKHNNENSKLLCVICNDPKITRKTNKTYKLFEKGFKDNTLCYLNNLQNIINAYFN
jgi:hypothetical protein